LTALTTRGCKAKQNADFTENLHIPLKAAVSNDRISEVFLVSYELKVTLKAQHKSDFAAIMPIYVGTIGFRRLSAVSQASCDLASMPIDGDAREFKF
jgi:hypothetical protein